MNDGFLSQEEIDSLLNGPGDKKTEENTAPADKKNENEEKTVQPENNSNENSEISDLEKDLLGEIGNISMGSASTALSQIINQTVNITTPVVSVTTLKDLKNTFEVPNVALEVKYTSGIMGENLLVMKVIDAAVIANLMMGGEGVVDEKIDNLSELEISAVSEAMNQMIGSSATSMATMLAREVNISPPESRVWNDITEPLSQNISEKEPVVKVSFKLKIGELVDSHIMQLLPMITAKKIVAIMMGEEVAENQPTESTSAVASAPEKPAPQPEPTIQQTPPVSAKEPPIKTISEKPIESSPKVEVKQAAFQNLGASKNENLPSNIDLILDVPLEISVVLGRTKRNIKEILNFGTGSLIELDKLAEEPVEILVNGKKVAYGEVVVVDENFGVRITSIVTQEERVKSLR
ncbi:flagellar motor switch protein FliN [Clostridium acetireducens DSM 10703]|uniref:Flagellar motor switch protein FliN n=1 Tax=Clostridium acetireducens DSM 10703 TaxID=1121290 RepID=A0A1E8EZG7_9CLOT|nr:flagellar motor switch phosphatase FliY [Clostridium acetireducens]OFI06513.1 flagellar motor switch protein FliN [Clostridium acetireducens DSM 10703]